MGIAWNTRSWKTRKSAILSGIDKKKLVVNTELLTWRMLSILVWLGTRQAFVMGDQDLSFLLGKTQLLGKTHIILTNKSTSCDVDHLPVVFTAGWYQISFPTCRWASLMPRNVELWFSGASPVMPITNIQQQRTTLKMPSLCNREVSYEFGRLMGWNEKGLRVTYWWTTAARAFFEVFRS